MLLQFLLVKIGYVVYTSEDDFTLSQLNVCLWIKGPSCSLGRHLPDRRWVDNPLSKHPLARQAHREHYR